jgi:hypothetical protein
VGAGLAIRATSETFVDRDALELGVVAARLGSVFVLGAVLVTVDSLGQLEPISTADLSAT